MWIITKNGTTINSNYISLLVVDGGCTVAYLIGDKTTKIIVSYGDVINKIITNTNAVLDFRGGE